MLSTSVVADKSATTPGNGHTLAEGAPLVTRTHRVGRTVLIRALQDLPENFSDIFAIDKIEYVEQAVALAALFNNALDLKTGIFDMAKAREIIKVYNEGLPPDNARYKLGIMKELQTTLSQSDSVVKAMVDKVLEAIKSAIGVALGATSAAQLTSAITDAFTDLKEQEGDAWIFWQKKTANKTTYSYTILFAIQDASTGRFMMCLPMSLLIEVDIAFEKVLWITLQDKTSYSVRIDAMQVAQVLVPASDGTELFERAHRLARCPEPAQFNVQAPNGPTTNVVVKNWSGTTVFATAAHGYFMSIDPTVQLTAWPPVTDPQHPLVWGEKYVVYSDNNPAQVLYYNGTMPSIHGEVLWFVSH